MDNILNLHESCYGNGSALFVEATSPSDAVMNVPDKNGAFPAFTEFHPVSEWKGSKFQLFLIMDIMNMSMDEEMKIRL